MKIELPKNELKALLPFAAQDETRFSLCGINIELRKGKHPLLISTDGRRLAVLKSEAEPWDSDATQFLLPRTLLEMVFKLCGDMGALPFTVEGKTITCKFLQRKTEMLVSLEYPQCEVAFPKWRQVVPKKVEHAGNLRRVSFNPGYMADYAKVATALRSDKHPGLLLYAEDDFSPMVVRIQQIPAFYAVLMPMRIDGGESADAPDWIEMGELEQKAPEQGNKA